MSTHTVSLVDSWCRRPENRWKLAISLFIGENDEFSLKFFELVKNFEKCEKFDKNVKNELKIVFL